MSTRNVLISILAAATAGAIVGMLYAPKKGRNIRRKIANGGKRYFEDAVDKYNEVVDEVEEAIEDMKLHKQEIIANGNGKIFNKKWQTA